MAYLQDILGLLSLRDNVFLGRDTLAQRAREFEAEFGLSKQEAERMARQWQQQFEEQQNRRRFEQQQQQQTFAQQQAQQNYLNQQRDFAQGSQFRQGRTNDLLRLLQVNPGAFGREQTNAAFGQFGLPGYPSEHMLRRTIA